MKHAGLTSVCHSESLTAQSQEDLKMSRKVLHLLVNFQGCNESFT
jgi:hypothetical protein